MSMKSRALVCALSTVVSLSSDTAWAQKDKESGPASGAGLPSRIALQPSNCPVTSKEIDDLFKTYADFSQWNDLQKSLSKKIAECTGAESTDEAPYIVTLIRPGENLSVIVPQPERYSLNLPGGPRHVHVLILIDRHAATEKTLRDFRFTSVKVPNDLLTQLPDVAKPIVTAVGGGLIGAAPSWQIGFNTFALDRQPPAKTPPPFKTAAFNTNGSVALPSANVSIVQTGTVSLWTGEKAEDVQLTASFTNKTKRRAEFMAVAGALVGRMFGDEKMKVSDDKYASDPIARGLTMAAIAVHPKPYDATIADMSAAERVAILFGGVLTPAPGFGGGLSVAITRGFGFNVGGAVMFVPTSQDGLKPKQQVPEGNNQLRYGWTHGIFTGISYVFKGS